MAQGQKLAAFCVLAAFAVLAWRNAAGLAASVRAVRAWDARYTTARAGEGAARLFRDLVELGLIRFEAATGRLGVEDCDFERKAAIGAGGPDGADAGRERSSMKRLCETETGYAIREQVYAWNRLGLVLAARDDRARGEPCEDGQPPDLGALPWGCHPGHWRIETESADGRRLEAPSEEGLAPAPAVFGFAALGRHAGFGDWISAGTSGLEGATHRLSTQLEPKAAARLLTVQIAGRVLEVLIDGRPAVPPDVETRALCAGASRTRACEDEDDGTGAGDRRPRVEQATIKIPASANPVDIAVRVAPLGVVPGELRAAASAKLVGRPRDKTARAQFKPRFRAESIVMACRSARGAAGRACYLDWEPPPAGTGGGPSRAGAKFRIMAGETELASTDAGGAAAKAAYDLGVASWIGARRTDYLSLAFGADRLARSGKETELKLTLDPLHQAAAMSALTALVTRRYAKVTESALPAKHDGARRGAIVLLDADARPGAILAAAVWPRLGEAAPPHEWDLAAYDLFEPAGSPLASRAWAYTDQLAAPGSTFKIVTALSFLAAMRDDPSLRDFLQGMPEPRMRKELGVTACEDTAKKTAFDCLEIDGSTLRNFEDEPLAHAEQELPCDLPSDLAPREKGIGLRQAIAFSNNLYFAGLTMRLARSASPRDHALARAIARFYPLAAPGAGGGAFPLAPHAQAAIRNARRVAAEPILADFLEGGPDERKRLALASYGQTVQSSPVAIASVMAGMALGRKVTPYLLSGPLSGAAPGSGDLLLETMGAARQGLLLNEIRCGMRAAVTHGTAKGKIAASLVPGIYGKTGTAEVAGVAENTVWFAGWLDGLPGSRLPRRVAFACMVTHASGTGGGVCAPLMSDLLLSLRERSGVFAAGPPRRPSAKARLLKRKTASKGAPQIVQKPKPRP